MAVLALAGVHLALLAGGGPASAQTATTTTVTEAVTVEPGPSHLQGIVTPCSDVGRGVDEQLSFVLRRTGPTAAPLTVNYTVSGSAQPSVHYEPLPGSASFPPGASSVTVPVTPRATGSATLVQLTLTVAGPPGSPSATIQFVSPRSQTPVECGYDFTDDVWNTAQAVGVGAGVHRLTLEEVAPPLAVPAAGVFRVVSGTLPAGVTLRADGSFTGTARSAGTFRAKIEACRPAPPGTCVTTDLTVRVTGTGAILPRTGAGRSTTASVAVAVLLLAAGSLCVSRAARAEGR